MIAGATPIRTSAKANVAFAGATTMSHDATRPIPPALTAPFSAAITGFGACSRDRRRSGYVTPAEGCAPLRSAPEQKTVPVAVSTIARTSSSPAAVLRWAASSDCSGADRALRFAGESRVIVATPSARSRWTSSVMIA